MKKKKKKFVRIRACLLRLPKIAFAISEIISSFPHHDYGGRYFAFSPHTARGLSSFFFEKNNADAHSIVFFFQMHLTFARLNRVSRTYISLLKKKEKNDKKKYPNATIRLFLFFVE